MEFTSMVTVTFTVADKEDILKELERVHEDYPYTDIDEVWDSAVEYIWQSSSYDDIENAWNSKLNEYVDFVVHEFCEKHPEIVNYNESGD